MHMEDGGGRLATSGDPGGGVGQAVEAVEHGEAGEAMMKTSRSVDGGGTPSRATPSVPAEVAPPKWRRRSSGPGALVGQAFPHTGQALRQARIQTGETCPALFSLSTSPSVTGNL